MHSAAGEIPYEPCLDRAEEQLIRLGECTCARNVVKDPLYLCAGEIRVYNKTGLILYVFLHILRLYPARSKDGSHRLELAEKYLHRVMLDPACGGIDLIELLLRLGYDIALFVENDGA